MSIWSQLSSLTQRAFEPAGEPGTELDAPLCGPDPNDVEFTAAIVGLGAKLAKADGLVTVDEVTTFARVFRSAPGDENFAYPSLLQSRDGLIHLAYSRNYRALAHRVFAPDFSGCAP